MTEPPYLTVGDVAKQFGVNSTTVYRLAQRGEIPGFKVGGQWRFSEEMLRDWVANRVMRERLKIEEEKQSEEKKNEKFPRR